MELLPILPYDSLEDNKEQEVAAEMRPREQVGQKGIQEEYDWNNNVGYEQDD